MKELIGVILFFIGVIAVLGADEVPGMTRPLWEMVAVGAIGLTLMFFGARLTNGD